MSAGARLQSDNKIFNRRHMRANRCRAAPHIDRHSFLFDWTAENMAERLGEIRRTFPATLLIGSRARPHHNARLKKEGQIETLICADIGAELTKTQPAVALDEEWLPFAKNTLDAIIGNLTLHSVNDLPGALIQINRALKPDGLFLGAMFGGETLYELRQSFNAAEMKLRNGISPHVMPFADKQQAGALMQRAGFALPVVDSEIVKVTYDDAFKLMHDLRGMGESNIVANRNNFLSGRELMMEMARYYAENYRDGDKIEATFEIIFMIGWAPHETQQKPLRPGSAGRRLADILETEEISTGDTAKP